MTQTPENEKLPTPWRIIDMVNSIEVRQVRENAWEMRSPSYIITVDKEGFDVFRENNENSWAEYASRKHVQWVRRN